MEGFKPSAEWTIGGAASLLEIDSDEFTIADGNTFYVELAVRNHAGLEATVITDGVTVGAFHATCACVPSTVGHLTGCVAPLHNVYRCFCATAAVRHP